MSTRIQSFVMVQLVMLILLGGRSLAQWSIEPNLVSMYDDNVANNYLQLSDRLTTLSLTSGYAFGGERWNGRFSYDGALNYYQNITEMSNQFHAANLAFSLLSGVDDENSLDLGLSFGQGFYRGTLSFYNNTQLSANASYKHFLNDWIITTLAYQFRSVRFSQVGDLSYSEHAISGNFKFALPTSTTVILQTDLGAKYYATPGLTEMMGSRGSSLAPDVAQLTGMARIGQSVADGTGLSVMVKYQWNALKQSRFLTSDAGFISDDELFDDHYGYEGLHGSVMLTQVLPGSALLRITGGIQNRLYSSLAAYDLDGNVLSGERIDQRSYISFLARKEFDAGFTVKAVFDLIRNSSNDRFYDYRNRVVTVELSLPF